MNLLYILLFILIIIIIIWIFYIFIINTEHFSNTENRKIYNIFKNVMENNGTLYEFKQKLNKNNIKFSNNDLKFKHYIELLKKYNKNNLNIDIINNIRNNQL
jgi:competence protein ComGC